MRGFAERCGFGKCPDDDEGRAEWITKVTDAALSTIRAGVWPPDFDTWCSFTSDEKALFADVIDSLEDDEIGGVFDQTEDIFDQAEEMLANYPEARKSLNEFRGKAAS